MRPSLLKIDCLTKKFGSFTAVDAVSLNLAAGEIYGFLGPNGAGKTTTIKMLAGLLQPTGGTITICDQDLASQPYYCKNLTGYIPDRPYLYEKLTGSEYLGFISSLYSVTGPDPLHEADRYLELFDLTGWKDHLIEGYSHGMRQKLIMTSIFMLDQPLIVIDEPMVGLDPKSARIVKELLKSKAKAGAGILLSTHSMEIAEELCDRIGIIVHGRIKAEGTMEELRGAASYGRDNLEDIFLELTGASELHAIISALRSAGNTAGTAGIPEAKV
ncbi:MAG: ABC transporter ATP-binding protein [Desulforhopalus sp.]|nr:ABC transporter ATP-binding protein [Desulforhopalus sp.]